MISSSIIQKVLDCASSTGADYAELFYENTTGNTIQMSNQVITSVLTGRDSGASIRVFSGLNSYYGFTTDSSEQGLLSLASKVACAVTKGKKASLPTLVTAQLAAPNHTLLLPSDVSNKAKAEALKQAYFAAENTSPKCMGIQAMYHDVEQHVLVATTHGKIFTETRPYTRLQVSLAAIDGGITRMGFEDYMEALGFDCIVKADPSQIGMRAAQSALEALQSKPCPSGEMPVIFAPSAGGTFLHEACGHPLEAASAGQENTLFYGSIGKKMLHEKVFITDNGLYPNGWGSTAVDDEGIPGQRTALVEAGVVKNFMIDRLNARRMDMKPTGNGRKQSYRMLPTSRMHQLYMEPGQDTLADMLSGIETGLYVTEIGGGAANGNTGEFTVSASKAYLIRNGQIGERLGDATLIGKTLEAMNCCDMVGNDPLTHFSGGYCGASSGNLPVGNATPHIRITKLKVAGRN